LTVLTVCIPGKGLKSGNGAQVPDDALHGMKDCYKIMLRGAGYRLVYRVGDERIFILVLPSVSGSAAR